MPNVLVRDIPQEALDRLDARARALGLSRQDFLRRQLLQEARLTPVAVTAADLDGFSERFADLADEEIMRGAWE
jgi:hypothetical protein